MRFAAADRLLEAVGGPITFASDVASIELRRMYQSTVDEPVPPALLETLSKLGSQGEGNHGSAT
jgi:hypothetical protein